MTGSHVTQHGKRTRAASSQMQYMRRQKQRQTQRRPIRKRDSVPGWDWGTLRDLRLKSAPPRDTVQSAVLGARASLLLTGAVEASALWPVACTQHCATLLQQHVAEVADHPVYTAALRPPARPPARTHARMHARMHTRTHTRMHMGTHARMHICPPARPPAHMCAPTHVADMCVRACGDVCGWLIVYPHASASVRAHMCACMHACVRACAHARMRAGVRVRAGGLVCVRACVRAWVREGGRVSLGVMTLWFCELYAVCR